MAEERFEGSGPVARYWLANCAGFAVRGGVQGTVEELLRDADPFVTSRLVVRRGRRRTVVPVEAVAGVIPAERTVLVRRRRETRPAAGRTPNGGVPPVRRRRARSQRPPPGGGRSPRRCRRHDQPSRGRGPASPPGRR